MTKLSRSGPTNCSGGTEHRTVYLPVLKPLMQEKRYLERRMATGCQVWRQAGHDDHVRQYNIISLHDSVH